MNATLKILGLLVALLGSAACAVDSDTADESTPDAPVSSAEADLSTSLPYTCRSETRICECDTSVYRDCTDMEHDGVCRGDIYCPPTGSICWCKWDLPRLAPAGI